MLRLVKWELFKLSRQRGSYVGFVLSLVFVIVMIVGFKMSHWHYLTSFKAIPFDPTTLIRGPFFAHYSLQVSFYAFLPLMAATLGGSQIAGEAQVGTLRNLLVRPPSRITLFAAKTIATFVWLQVNVIFVLLSVLVGRIAFGGGPMLVFIWELRGDGPYIVDSPGCWALLATVTLGAGVALFVISSLSLMISTFTDAPVIAHVGTLGGFFISSVVQRLPDQLVADEVREALPGIHMNFRHQLFRLWAPGDDLFDAHRFWIDVAWCSGFIIVFLGTALTWFARKDITS